MLHLGALQLYGRAAGSHTDTLPSTAFAMLMVEVDTAEGAHTYRSSLRLDNKSLDGVS